jgi:[ribosomal protein S5]-alanine N-acetyltransferase
MNHSGTIVLETERLILRPLRLADAEYYTAIWNSNAWIPPFSIEQTDKLQKRISQYRRIDIYDWGIALKATDTVVGEILTVNNDDKMLSCEIAYSMNQRHRNKGYTTEALAYVLKYLLLEVGYNRIQAGHLADNPASGRVMEKAGMVYEGTLRQDNRNADGVLTDSKIYSMILTDIVK